MKGLEISEVRLCDIDLNDRIDAEYFNKQDLKILSSLKHCGSVELRTLGEFFASAFYPAATQLYESGDVPFARCVDCISHPVITHAQDTSFERIPSDFISDNKGVSDLRRGDIIITKVGTPCYASIIHEHDRLALSRTVMGIGNVSGIDPYYLLVFLRSKYGFSQLMRQRELTIQYQLTLERVKRILVYKPTDCFQQAIRKLVFSSLEKEKESLRQYGEAEQSLLSELGFDGWTPTEESVSVKNCSDFMSAGRFDAEYFQPKYDDYFNMITKYRNGHKRLGDLTIQNTTQCDKTISDYDYIEIGDVDVGNATYCSTRLSVDDLPANAKIMAHKGDLIISKVRPNRGAVAIIEDDRSDLVVSGAFTVVAPKDEIFSECLLALLRTNVYRDWLLRWAVGSSYPVVKDEDVLNMPIPLFDKDIQQTISAKVRKSFALRAESKRLIDLAKHAVEVAIEHGEEKAMEILEVL